MSDRYAIAPRGIFWSLQGEGHLQGFQQAFLRLAGCSVGCAGCDTNYSVSERLALPEIVGRLAEILPERVGQWVWITGGEPADLPQPKQVALISALKSQGWSVCVATSGAKRFIPPVDWLSVSYHGVKPTQVVQHYANEIKLVEGLNGLDLDEWADRWDDEVQALYRYVQPLSRRYGEHSWKQDAGSMARCMEFLRTHPRWALSEQRHHQWGVL